ncbi:MAG: glycosyltransferase family 9 protein [Bacteroidales bacterium]|jgi:ADP-heptose:LPS heptosyltransferase|nr:glycosyltransferase family 9 protein [Bacteroidales bacterium]
MDDNQPPATEKILIIRLSSIGDVVLVTPIIRAVKQAKKEARLHFLIKKEFKPVIEPNPYLDKIHVYGEDTQALIRELKAENFSYIIDLQNNIRSKRVISALQKPHKTFPKLNFKKWLAVCFKLNLLPDRHIVDRYFEAVKLLHVPNDQQGLNFFIAPNETYEEDDLPAVFKNGFVAVSLGSMHGTKRIPAYKVVEIARILHLPIMLLGGKDVENEGEEIVSALGERAYNGCGKFSLHQTASLIRQSRCLLTGDTGLMHIAAALQTPIASLWGNTIPEFGMYPYMPQHRERFRIFETPRLRCRPCSKLGYKKCPKKHFRCMNQISAIEVAEWINTFA